MERADRSNPSHARASFKIGVYKPASCARLWRCLEPLISSVTRGRPLRCTAVVFGEGCVYSEPSRSRLDEASGHRSAYVWFRPERLRSRARRCAEAGDRPLANRPRRCCESLTFAEASHKFSAVEIDRYAVALEAIGSKRRRIVRYHDHRDEDVFAQIMQSL